MSRLHTQKNQEDRQLFFLILKIYTLVKEVEGQFYIKYFLKKNKTRLKIIFF